MVVVTIKGKMDVIEIMGHAMYDDFGKDIVCSGISSIVTTTVNAILTFDKNYIKYTIKGDLFTIKVNTHNNIVDNLLNNMINMLKELEKDYPKNIKIGKEN